jgi:hypothetical protein
MAMEITDEEINEILDEFEEEIEETDRSLIRLIALGIVYDIFVFKARIDKTINVLRGTGMSEDGIRSVLANDLSNHESIFGELRNSIVRGIVFGNNQFSRVGQLEVYGDSIELYEWITIEGKKICDDCAPRRGQVDTLDNWMERGMPGSGWSVCGGRCYCILVPVGNTANENIIVD